MKKEENYGINFVFRQNPELEKIGNKQQYEEYIKTIFPESKVKNLVYHQTPKKFEDFEMDKSKSGNGIYFSPFNRETPFLARMLFDWTTKNYTKTSLLNMKNPFIISKKKNKKFEKYLPNIDKLKKKTNLENYDGVVGFSNVFYDKGQLDSDSIEVSPDTKNNIEFVAFNPEQIHVLGSHKDVKGFKEFVDNHLNNKSSLENKVLSSFFILLTGIGLFLTTFNLTGNITGISDTAHKFIGIILFLLGVSGFFIYRKSRS